MLSNNTCRVVINYICTQDTITQDSYDEMMGHVSTVEWLVTMNDTCKAYKLVKTDITAEHEESDDAESHADFAVEDYFSQIEQRSKEAIVYTQVDDFDGDGVMEAFVVTGSAVNDYDTWQNSELWFVDKNREVIRVAGEDTFPQWLLFYEEGPSITWQRDGTRYAFFCAEASGGGPTSTSHVFGVRDGSPVEATLDMEYVGLLHNNTETGQIVGSVTVSTTPRMWQRYGFDFDPDGYQFSTTGTIGEPQDVP